LKRDETMSVLPAIGDQEDGSRCQRKMRQKSNGGNNGGNNGSQMGVKFREFVSIENHLHALKRALKTA